MVAPPGPQLQNNPLMPSQAQMQATQLAKIKAERERIMGDFQKVKQSELRQSAQLPAPLPEPDID